jgi:hypothetical protein
MFFELRVQMVGRMAADVFQGGKVTTALTLPKQIEQGMMLFEHRRIACD